MYLGARAEGRRDVEGDVPLAHRRRICSAIVAGILEGEIQRTEGDLPAAIAAFERAVELQDALTYDEPEPLPFAARHWLGAALLEAKRFERRREASIATTSRTTRTTAGRSSGCSRR